MGQKRDIRNDARPNSFCFVKSRRPHFVGDFETWKQSDKATTLNVFDNNSDIRATVLIVEAEENGD